MFKPFAKQACPQLFILWWVQNSVTIVFAMKTGLPNNSKDIPNPDIPIRLASLDTADFGLSRFIQSHPILAFIIDKEVVKCKWLQVYCAVRMRLLNQVFGRQCKAYFKIIAEGGFQTQYQAYSHVVYIKVKCKLSWTQKRRPLSLQKLFESFKMNTHMKGPNHGHKIPLLWLKAYPG